MGENQKQKHTKETFYYALSRMFERTSYYGLRGLVVLYMVGEILKMENTEALTIYGWFTASLVFSQIAGALLGDLLIGNKRSLIIGGIIQAIGAFCFCIPSKIGLYLGLSLVVLGSGFFTPNIISVFGKTYLNKLKLLDSGFTIFYLAVNLGSFLGVLLIGYLGDIFGYNIGFIISGILMLLSLVPIIVLKKTTPLVFEKSEMSIGKKVLNILIAFLVVGLFWGIYEISNIRIFDLQMQFSEISTLEISKSMWQSIGSVFTIPISLIAIILWTYFYSNQFFKLMLGFIFGVISFGILFLIPETPTADHTITFMVSLLFLGISEIHIAPIIHSILTKYSNPKYLAILISIAFIPTRLVSVIFALFSNIFYDNPILGLKFGIITMTVVGIGLIAYVWWDKKTTYNKFFH